MYQMDAIDYAILEILKDDGRCTYSDIAEQVNLSRVAALASAFLYTFCRCSATKQSWSC